MKYIITESRLDKLVQDFITNSVGELERHTNPEFGDTYIYYTTVRGETVFEISEGAHGLGLGVLESIWNLVHGIFSLSDYETNIAFLSWMENNVGWDYADEVYTFENE